MNKKFFFENMTLSIHFKHYKNQIVNNLIIEEKWVLAYLVCGVYHSV